jgi:hypothetical protein
MSPAELTEWMEKAMQQPKGSWYYRNVGKFMMEETFQVGGSPVPPSSVCPQYHL